MRIRDKGTPAKIVGSFLDRKEGSVATIFAVSLVPVVIAAGIGIDVSRALSSRGNLQDALDVTALALAHMPSNSTQEQLDAKANAWMTANLHDGNMAAPTVTVTMTKGQLALDATSKVTTTLTAIAGYKEMPIAAHSTVKWGLGHVEVALVLDNTGSMSGTKLSRLKTAALDLVTTLEESVSGADDTALKISVVPFSTTVRLSSDSTTLNTYKSASWMKAKMPTAYGDDLFVNNNNVNNSQDRFDLFSTLGTSWAGCVESRPAPYDVQDTAPNSTNPGTYFTPYFAPDEPDDEALVKSTNWRGTSYYESENSYISDNKTETQARNKLGNSADALALWRYIQGHKDKYTGKISNSVLNAGKGPNRGCSMQPLVRLTTNMTTVKAALNAMNATGNTNIPIGMMWGWHTLSPNAPFADGVSYSDTDTKKFIVLLTDGDNVYGSSDNPSNSLYTTLGYAWQSRMSGITVTSSDGTRTGVMDTRLGVVCTNIKSAGITVFAVRIDVSGDAPASLSGCASSSDKFYDINSSGLSEAFQNIAGSIGSLRIAQ